MKRDERRADSKPARRRPHSPLATRHSPLDSSQSIALTPEHGDFPAEAVLERVTRALSEMGSLEGLIKLTLAEGRRLLKARDIYVLLREDEHLVLRGALGLLLERDEARAARLPIGTGLEGLAAEQARTIFAYDAEAEPGYRAFPGRRGRAGALLAVPLRLRGRVIGVVAATRSEPGWFSEREARWLTILAQTAAVSIENERLRAAEQQEAKLKAREDFLTVVSHELKTPVAVIKAYVEVLLRRAADRTGASADVDVLQHVHDQADRMLAMIEELLDLQRLELGQLRLELSRFDLVALVQRVLSGLQVAATSHRLRYAGQAEPLPVVADRKRIEEVITNLVDNAVKYSPPQSEVAVEVRGVAGDQQTDEDGHPHQAMLIVSDRGIGISGGEQQHIFERFYQVHGAPVRGHVGLGLGLYISREIVQHHGGRMWVESTPGEGSRFYVTLPRPPEDGAD